MPFRVLISFGVSYFRYQIPVLVFVLIVCIIANTLRESHCVRCMKISGLFVNTVMQK